MYHLDYCRRIESADNIEYVIKQRFQATVHSNDKYDVKYFAKRRIRPMLCDV